MYRILSITTKDLLQLVRDGKIYLFLLIMPIAFTLLFGYAFGSIGGGEEDPRLPVALINQDQSTSSKELNQMINQSKVLRVVPSAGKDLSQLEKDLDDGELAGIILIPAGYEENLMNKKAGTIELLADPSSTSTSSLQTDLLVASRRVGGSVWSALIANEVVGTDFQDGLDYSLRLWENPPLSIETTYGKETETIEPPSVGSMAHTSPGMMLQFSIAGLLTAATIIVVERNSRSLARLLTTPIHRMHILLGHYLAIFILVFIQFIVLIFFGQLMLKVDYLRVPQATFLVAFCAALCVSALGLLIGVLAKNDGQAIIFSLIPMFILSGLGGAWVPLELTGAAFQTIGHFSPVAWAMDGFKNITVRGLGMEAVLIPSLALVGYALLFFLISVLVFNRAEK